MVQQHAIFDDIWRGDLEAVQQRVLANGAMLEEREETFEMTPLIYAIDHKKTAIALWIIEHRGQHDLEEEDNGDGSTALHWDSKVGLLEVAQALVAAGADPEAYTELGDMPLIIASYSGHTDVVTFLCQLPAVKARIDDLNESYETALSSAAFHGHQPIVQLLLDAGADPTNPKCIVSPLDEALRKNHHAIAAFFIEPDRASALHKARSLRGGGAASLACLQGRVEQGEVMPLLELPPPQQQQQQQQRRRWQRRRRRQVAHDGEREKLRATAAFAVGVSGGEKDRGCATICT